MDSFRPLFTVPPIYVCLLYQAFYQPRQQQKVLMVMSRLQHLSKTFASELRDSNAGGKFQIEIYLALCQRISFITDIIFSRSRVKIWKQSTFCLRNMAKISMKTAKFVLRSAGSRTLPITRCDKRKGRQRCVKVPGSCRCSLIRKQQGEVGH